MVPIYCRFLSPLEAVRGLMFREKIEPVYFKTRFGIHTFFVKENIDILILDNACIVRDFREHVPPNRIILWSWRYSTIVELPANTISQRKIKKGTSIRIMQSQGSNLF